MLKRSFRMMQIIKGEDRATLVTCTPYGINTHRLLVHGRRMEEGFADVEAPGEKTEHSRDSQWQKRYQYAALIGGLLIIGIILFTGYFKNCRHLSDDIRNISIYIT